MKHFYRFLFTFLVVFYYSNSIQAQIENYYTFSEGTASYEPLTGATEQVLRAYSYDYLSIPFEFEYAGKIVSRVVFHSNGSINFGGTSTPQPNSLSYLGQQNQNGYTGIIAPLWDNYMTVAQDNVVAKRNTLVSGTAPNRTFTIEWEKVLWTDVLNPNTTSEVSFRIVLEETTNNISFIYGPNNSTDGSSASIGLNTTFVDQLSFISVTPGTSGTTSSITSNDNITPTEYPGEGVSYTFTYVAPDCGIPSNLVIDNNSLTPNSVDINWVNSGTETEWEILLINLSNSTRETFITNSNPYTLNNLEEDTSYSISIRSKCTSTDSHYTSQTFFKTPARCPIPSNLSTTEITLDSASFTWQAGSSETSWEAIVIPASEPEPINGNIVTSASYNVSGLVKDSDYVIYVRADCDTEGLSKWTIREFRTLATCQIPTTLTITNEICDSGTVGWTSNGTETEWEISITDINTEEETNYTTDTNPFTVTNLEINRTYRVKVRAICADDDISRYSSFDFIKTKDVTEPVASCVAPFTLQLDETGSAVITAQDIDNNSYDNCAIQSIEIDKTNFTTWDIGEQVVTLTITDFSGNRNSCTTVVTIQGETFSIEDYITGLITPRGLAFDKDQMLYIAEYNTGKIYKATDVETITEYASTGFNNNGIALDELGILYVAENFLSRILSFNTNGQESTYLSSSDGINSPWDLEYDYSGNLYISNFSSGSILKVTPEGDITTHASGLFSPEGMSFDSSGNLYVADRNDAKLQKIAPNGSVTTVLSGSNYIGIRAVAVDGADFVYLHQQVGFGSSATEKIIKYNPNDGAVIDIVGGLDDVNYLKFNNAGDLFISQDDRVSVIRGVGEPNTLSVGEVVLDKTSIQFYPNPVKDRIVFTKSPSEIIIYDISGKAVFESKNSLNEYDLSELINGIYFVKVINHIGDSAVIKISKV